MGLRHSGLARVGLLALIVLAYLVYTVGTLLEVGLGRLVTAFPVVEVLGATVALTVGLVFVQWFFETEPTAVEPDEPDEGEEAPAA